MYLSRTSIILKQNRTVHYWRLFKVSAFSFNRKIVILLYTLKSIITINQKWRSNHVNVNINWSLIVVIGLAITIFRNPDLKDKNLIMVLMALILLFVILDIIWYKILLPPTFFASNNQSQLRLNGMYWNCMQSIDVWIALTQMFLKIS